MSIPLALHAGSDNSITQYQAFSAWLKATVTTRIVFADNSSWGGIQNPYMLATTKEWLVQGAGYNEVITIGLCPTTYPPVSTHVHLSAVWGGTYDTYFTTLGNNLANLGSNPATGKPYANQIIIRLGHELNGDWYQWAIGTDNGGTTGPGTWNSQSDYQKAFQHVVNLIRAKAPGVKFDLNFALTGRTISGGFASSSLYPGNAYVDYITIDVYDDFNSGWGTILNGGNGVTNGGLNAYRAFALSKNKPEAYPEWACDTSSNGRGDDLQFVHGMLAWFLSVGANGLAYQSYYDTSAWAGNAVIHTGTVTCPRASQAYQTCLGKLGLTLSTTPAVLSGGMLQPQVQPTGKNLGAYCDGSKYFYLS